jgi:hypothetical protein
MQQLSIDYFWPLTEQIPLDLDYTDCKKPQSSMFIDPGAWSNFPSEIPSEIFRIDGGGTGTTSIISARLNLDVDTTVIKTNTKPPLIRRGLYKLLGLKWEIK